MNEEGYASGYMEGGGKWGMRECGKKVIFPLAYMTIGHYSI
jgi:hypothetical protein